MFQGDLLNCTSSSDEIALLHSRFNMSTSGICNSGRVRGHSLATNDSRLATNDSKQCYTSRLYVMVSPDMIGKSITCAYDNGTIAEPIGNYSIEQCHVTTVTTIALSTGKFVIHMGINNK